MHFVNESATNLPSDSTDAHAPSLRETRKRHTREVLIKLAREFTAQHGLAGFTVEELCEAAEISRRTFFNHFASKDDAVLGMGKQAPFESGIHEFLNSRNTVPLAEAITELIAHMIDSATGSELTPDELMALIHQEPSLMNRLKHNGLAAIREIERLICEREGLESPSAYAGTIAFTVHHLTMATILPPPDKYGEACAPDAPASLDKTQNNSQHDSQQKPLHKAPYEAPSRERFIADFGERLKHLSEFLTAK